MTYQEKLKITDECFQLLISGTSLESVREKLAAEGYYEYDINKIMPSVRSAIEQKFASQLDADLKLYAESSSNKYGLAEDTFEYIKEARIQYIKAEITDDLHKLVRDKVANEEILERLKSPFYTESEILDKIEKSKTSFHQSASERVKKEDNGKTSMLIGSLIIIVFLFFGRLSLWGVGLLIYGIYKYFNQEVVQTSKVEIDDIGKE